MFRAKYISILLIAFLFLIPKLLWAAPKGAVKLPSSKLFSKNDFYCGKIGAKFIAGRMVGVFFYSLIAERNNVITAAAKASGIKKINLNKKAKELKNLAAERNLQCSVGPGWSAAEVSLGADHTCAMTAVGGAKCWGDNVYYQLGDGTTESSNFPVSVNGISEDVVQISAGSYHTCVLMVSGGVKCWGNNAYGQLGIGSYNSSSVPVDVSGLTSGVAVIASGDKNTCALLETGGVKCWGRGSNGGNGDGSYSNRTTPVDVVGLTSGVVAIASGITGHTCAILSDGSVKCWGLNMFAQLGNGSTNPTSIPVSVAGLSSNVLTVSPGLTHTCALMSDESLKCWGRGDYGQLGNASSLDSAAPVAVAGLTKVKNLSSGAWHTCAFSTDQNTRCWGYNMYGQIGVGSVSEQYNVPSAVIDLGANIFSVAAGGYHSCAIENTGLIKCWGDNTYGQLGAGITDKILTTPTTVVQSE